MEVRRVHITRDWKLTGIVCCLNKLIEVSKSHGICQVKSDQIVNSVTDSYFGCNANCHLETADGGFRNSGLNSGGALHASFPRHGVLQVGKVHLIRTMAFVLLNPSQLIR